MILGIHQDPFRKQHFYIFSREEVAREAMDVGFITEIRTAYRDPLPQKPPEGNKYFSVKLFDDGHIEIEEERRPEWHHGTLNPRLVGEPPEYIYVNASGHDDGSTRWNKRRMYVRLWAKDAGEAGAVVAAIAERHKQAGRPIIKEWTVAS